MSACLMERQRNDRIYGRIACVTGASGMIGRRVVLALLARGCNVRVLTRRLDQMPGVEIFRGGLSDQSVLDNFIRGADMVFHCAAQLNDEALMQEVNVVGTQAVSDAARRHQIKYLCHLSSAGVVGTAAARWIDEASPCRPQYRYEQTKFDAEACLREPIPGCSTVILRPTNVVDENHLGELALPVSASPASRLKVFIKGGECAHIVYAEDVARAALHFIDRPALEVRIFFVSLDHDSCNTVAHLWVHYRNALAGKDGRGAPVFPHLPAGVPHLLRKLQGKAANRGDLRYSSRRLLAEGFQFSYNVEDIVRKIVNNRRAVQLANTVDNS